ncbi:MAG: hypothetical protein FJZ56_05365 [Chlamydiae bacterium]|nr:hypothetical protein [Chlamydiota bacterium]
MKIDHTSSDSPKNYSIGVIDTLKSTIENLNKSTYAFSLYKGQSSQEPYDVVLVFFDALKELSLTLFQEIEQLQKQNVTKWVFVLKNCKNLSQVELTGIWKFIAVELKNRSLSLKNLNKLNVQEDEINPHDLYDALDFLLKNANLRG